jgi:hypothetical protein
MSQQELLTAVISALDRSGIPYMLTGSVVSSMQGEPRATHDIDVIVSLRAEDIDRVAAAFPPPRYYLDRLDAEEAIRHGSMFNLIDAGDGGKVDFWMLGEDGFDVSRFGRRIHEHLLGATAWISTPEDTVLAKLRWAKMSGGSEKQFGDALRVYEVQHPRLDLAYLEGWARELGVLELWTRLLSEAVLE